VRKATSHEYPVVQGHEYPVVQGHEYPVMQGHEYPVMQGHECDAASTQRAAPTTKGPCPRPGGVGLLLDPEERLESSGK